jgi:hypothetical protein
MVNAPAALVVVPTALPQVLLWLLAAVDKHSMNAH